MIDADDVIRQLGALGIGFGRPSGHDPLRGWPGQDWPAIERLVYEAGLRGDITASRGAEILGLRLQTWRDAVRYIADEGPGALLDKSLALKEADR